MRDVRRGRKLKALVAAMAALAGGSLAASAADAATAIVKISGDYNDSPYWSSWSIELRYHIQNYRRDPEGAGQSYDDRFSGGPDPIVYFTVINNPHPVGHRDYDPSVPAVNVTYLDVKSFSINTSPNQYSVQATFLDGRSLNVGFDEYLSLDPDPRTSFSLVDSFAQYSGTGDYGYWSFGGSPHAHSISVDVNSVPEPSTWALLLGGFGLAGAALRRRRSLVTPTHYGIGGKADVAMRGAMCRGSLR